MGTQYCKNSSNVINELNFQTPPPVISQSILLCKVPAQIRNYEQIELGLFLLNMGSKTFGEAYSETNFCDLPRRERKVFDQNLEFLFRDCPHHKGMKLEDGSIYEGQWSHGIRNGYGICQYPDESYYEGYWLNDLKHGYGVLHLQESVYEGKWFADQKFDEGTITSKTDKNNKFQLKMNLEQRAQDLLKKTHPIKKENHLYYGELHNDMMEGFGVLNFDDGRQFIGHFTDDQIYGFGMMKYENGNLYVGTWDNNQMSGIGEFTSKEGKYYGSYFEDQKCGYGVYIWNKDQVVFKGFFERGNMNGKGKLINQKDQQGDYIFQDGQRKNDKFGRAYTKKMTYLND